jgi:hypothetical protein
VSLLGLARLLPADVPVVIGRDAAQRLARVELARPEYAHQDETLVQRVISWILERIGDLLARVGGASPLAWFGIAGLIVLVVLVTVAVRRRTGSLGREPSAASLFTDDTRNARHYREDADRFAAAGAWAEAVRARLRAVVRDLEERDLVDARPGRTADEIARDAGAALPSVAGALHDGARTFDDVWYGGRTADATSYQRLVDLDTAVAAARPGDPVRRGMLAPAAPR